MPLTRRRQVRVDLADVARKARGAEGGAALLGGVVLARRRDAIAAGVQRRAARVVVALVDGDQEHGVALVDAVVGEPVEERGERGVVLAQLRLHAGLAGAERIAVIDVVLVVVHVGQVRVGDRDAGLLRRGGVAERVVGLHPVEAREARGCRSASRICVVGVRPGVNVLGRRRRRRRRRLLGSGAA